MLEKLTLQNYSNLFKKNNITKIISKLKCILVDPLLKWSTSCTSELFFIPSSNPTPIFRKMFYLITLIARLIKSNTVSLIFKEFLSFYLHCEKLLKAPFFSKMPLINNPFLWAEEGVFINSTAGAMLPFRVKWRFLPVHASAKKLSFLYYSHCR